MTGMFETALMLYEITTKFQIIRAFPVIAKSEVEIENKLIFDPMP